MTTSTVAFQLPLSGSQVNGAEKDLGDYVFYFQLPISGSLMGLDSVIYLALGRFQLPLSGSHVGASVMVRVREKLSFKLPLSGSPSPIPGFFGSPRLSAAAPLRTNDF